MEIALYICPFLIAALGSVLFLISPSSPSALKISIPIFVVILILSFMIAGLSNRNFSEIDDLNYQIHKLHRWKDRQISTLTGLIAELRPSSQDNGFRLQHFISFGWDIKNEALIRSLTAEKFRQQIIEKLPKDHFAATSVIVKNLPEDIDQIIVTQALEELGFTVEQRESPANLGTINEPNANDTKESLPDQSTVTDDTSPDNRESKTENKDSGGNIDPTNDIARRVNVMFYGTHVKSYEIKLIALTMLRAGVNLRYMKVAAHQNKNAKRTVHFDWSKSYRARPILEPTDIYSQSSFRRK